MPMYEYICECGKVLERIVKLSERDIKQKCECGKLAERVQVSKGTFHLKGSWFKTTGEY